MLGFAETENENLVRERKRLIEAEECLDRMLNSRRDLSRDGSQQLDSIECEEARHCRLKESKGFGFWSGKKDEKQLLRAE